MNDSADRHAPTQEFSEFLARDIARTLRHDARFAPAARSRRLGVIVVSIIGSVIALSAGLVFGTNTGYASARLEGDRQRKELATSTMEVTSQLTALRLDLALARADIARRAAAGEAPRGVLLAAEAELRSMEATAERIAIDLAQGHSSIAARQAVRPAAQTPARPMKRAVSAALNALAIAAEPEPVQQSIPTLSVAPAFGRTSEPLGAVQGVRQVAGGRVLVNDAGSRQVRLFDSTLATSIVTLDSTPDVATGYGARRMRGIPLTAYRGDSSLLSDPVSRTIRVLDANGQVARTFALPDSRVNLAGPTYTDDKGRLLFSGVVEWKVRTSDSLPILRVDLASNRVDTIGRVKAREVRGSIAWPGDSTVRRFTTFALDGQPASALVPARDDWAVLSDGSIAFVRGHDYHIDWIRPDGTMTSSPKLPFDWQRLAEESKAQADMAVRLAPLPTSQVGRGGAGGDSARFRLMVKDLRTLMVGLSAINMSATSVIPDLDGNLWILPTASAPSPKTERIYDVIDRSGELFQRVRIPEGRSVAGFGKGGVLYLVSGDRTNGFYLEQTRVVGGPKAR